MMSSGRPYAEETAVRVMSTVFDRIMVQFEVSHGSFGALHFDPPVTAWSGLHLSGHAR